MPEPYIELFTIEFHGKVKNLRNYIESIEGVQSTSCDKPGYYSSPTTLTMQITYDPHLTDRTRLCQQIEKQNETETVTLA